MVNLEERRVRVGGGSRVVGRPSGLARDELAAESCALLRAGVAVSFAKINLL